MPDLCRPWVYHYFPAYTPHSRAWHSVTLDQLGAMWDFVRSD